jgi:hypothetical protein
MAGFIQKKEFLLKFFIIDADKITMRQKKEITAYQINNVLRVYGEQLRRGRISNWREFTDTDAPDNINISARARRETIIDDITSNIVERITHFEPNQNVEIDPVKPVSNGKDRYDKLIFKEIDKNDETINSISIEDSKFLRNKLKSQKKKSGKNERA